MNQQVLEASQMAKTAYRHNFVAAARRCTEQHWKSRQQAAGFHGSSAGCNAKWLGISSNATLSLGPWRPKMLNDCGIILNQQFVLFGGGQSRLAVVMLTSSGSSWFWTNRHHRPTVPDICMLQVCQ